MASILPDLRECLIKDLNPPKLELDHKLLIQVV